MLSVGLKLRDELEKRGVRVEMTRDDDTFLELEERAWALIQEVEQLGGMTKAVESGMPKAEIEKAAGGRPGNLLRFNAHDPEVSGFGRCGGRLRRLLRCSSNVSMHD